MKSALMLVFAVAHALPAADLSGLIVTEHDGSPVVSAAVTIRSGDRVVAESETDSSGLFHVSVLPPADYTVAVNKASFATAERRVALTEAGADVLLQLTKFGVISGRVTDSQGNGVRNIVVAAVPVSGDEGPARVFNSRPRGAGTDTSGRYRIFGLPAGDYVVVALTGNARSVANITNGNIAADSSHGNTAQYHPSNGKPAVLPIRSGEEHTNIDFIAYTGPLFSIRGSVNGPSPDTAYRVSLVADPAGVPLASFTVQPGKEFQFTRVAPGAYKLVATRQVTNGIENIIELINSGQLQVAAEIQADLLREAAATRAANAAQQQPIEPAFAEAAVTVAQDLTGVLLSARPGIDAKLLYQPADGCPTSVQLTLNPVEYLGLGNISKKLDANTESALTDIPPGTYSASLTVPEATGCYAATTTLDFRQISSGATVPIVVAKMGGIQGKVDVGGNSAFDFTIALIDPNGFSRRTLSLAKDATFSIPNLRPGRYRVSVSRRSSTRVVAADTNVVVESGSMAQVEFPALP